MSSPAYTLTMEKQKLSCEAGAGSATRLDLVILNPHIKSGL